MAVGMIARMKFAAESNLPQTRTTLAGCFDSSKRVQAGMNIGRSRSQASRFAFVVIALVCSSLRPQGYASEVLRSHDVICFLGGANVVSAQEHGYLETLLRMKLPALN